jgi:hypothetical protein
MPEATEDPQNSQPQPDEQLPEEEQTDPAADEATEGNQPGADQEEDIEQEFEERRAHETAYSWQASEFVHHHKGVAWYIGLAGIILVPAAGLTFLHSWIELGALATGAVALLVYANKTPKALLYELTPEGIAIDGRTHPYGDFRSFSVLPDAEWHSIELEPAKRFQPPISVLFDSDDFDPIVGHLELHLPRDDRPPDLMDQLVRRLRF